METFDNINDRIRHIIEHDGETVASFARRLGVPDQTIRSYTIEKRKPSFDLIVKIIEATPWIDANWLVMGQEMPSRTDESESARLLRIVERQQDTIQMLTRQIDNLAQRLPENDGKMPGEL